MWKIDGLRSSALVDWIWIVRLCRLGFFDEVPDVDHEDSTRVGQLCVFRVLIRRFDGTWEKSSQVFREKRLTNLEQSTKHVRIGL